MSGAGRVTGFIGDVGGDRYTAVGQQSQIGRRNAGAPGTVCLHGGGIGFAIEGDGNDLPGFNIQTAAAQSLRCLHLGTVNNIVARKGADGQHRCVQRAGINPDGVGDAGAVTGAIGQGGDQVIAAIGQCGEIGGWQRSAPRTVRLNHCGVGFTVQRQRHGTTCIPDGGSARNRLVEQHFCAVKHVIPGNHADGEGRSDLIDHDGAIQGIAVARRIGDHYVEHWRPIRQRLQIANRNGDAPVAATVHGTGVGFIPKGHGDGLPRRGDAGGAGDGLRLACFRTVQDAIAKRRVQGGVWQVMDKHAQGMAAADRVTCLVDSGNAQVDIAVCQQGQIGRWYQHAPGTVRQRSAGVGFAVQRHGHACASSQVEAAAVDG
ncbi:hypothetical protein D3C79_547830 [compost metagenome]